MYVYKFVVRIGCAAILLLVANSSLADVVVGGQGFNPPWPPKDVQIEDSLGEEVVVNFIYDENRFYSISHTFDGPAVKCSSNAQFYYGIKRRFGDKSAKNKVCDGLSSDDLIKSIERKKKGRFVPCRTDHEGYFCVAFEGDGVAMVMFGPQSFHREIYQVSTNMMGLVDLEASIKWSSQSVASVAPGGR